jgi:hypothetical protein
MIYLYPDADTASIRIESNSTFTGPAILTRTDRNGTAPVRLKRAQSPQQGLAIRDYEAALFGEVTYTLKGDGITQTASTLLLEDFVKSDQLHLVTKPQYRFVPTLTLNIEPSRTSRNTFHEIVGRSTPLVVRGPLGSRRGDLEFLALDSDSVNAIEALQQAAGPFLFRLSEGVLRDLYFDIEDMSVSYDQGRWRVRISYIEVARPTGYLEGGVGITYAELRERHATYRDVRESFGTYRDILTETA